MTTDKTGSFVLVKKQAPPWPSPNSRWMLCLIIQILNYEFGEGAQREGGACFISPSTGFKLSAQARIAFQSRRSPRGKIPNAPWHAASGYPIMITNEINFDLSPRRHTK